MTTAGQYSSPYASDSSGEVSGWTGWVIFAAVIMIVSGSLVAIQGFVAIVNSNWAVWSNVSNVAASVTTWGWIHLIVGSVVVLAGLFLFTGNVLARVIAVALAIISLIANFLWLPVYPLWSLTVIALNVVVIWAIIVHGGDLRRS